VDGDDVAFRVGEGELAAERAIGKGGDDPDTGGGQLVVQRLRVVGLQPQRYSGTGPSGRVQVHPRQRLADRTRVCPTPNSASARSSPGSR
jgi:hypothetical protein